MILRDQKRHNGTLCKSCNKLINTIWDLVRLVTLDFLETSQSPHILFLESTNVKSSVCTTILEVEFMNRDSFPCVLPSLHIATQNIHNFNTFTSHASATQRPGCTTLVSILCILVQSVLNPLICVPNS